MSFKKILCAVDFSNRSIPALGQTVELARAGGGKVLLYHVIEAQIRTSEMRPKDGILSEATLEIENTAREAMESLVLTAVSSSDQMLVLSEIDVGQASDQILDRARNWGADLIVLSAKSSQLPEESVLGGTAKQVLDEADCSVLILR